MKEQVKIALFITLCIIALRLVILLSGTDTNTILVTLAFLIFPLGLYFGLKKEIKILESPKFNEIFKRGFMISIFVAVLVTIFGLGVQLSLPDIIEQKLQMAENTMYEGGAFTDEQIETVMYWSRLASSPLINAISDFFTFVISGAVLSLIYASIFKTKPERV